MIGQDPLMEVRAALLTTSNNDWSAGTTLGGAEINKRVEKLITETINRGVDIKPLISRKPLDQYAFIWNIRKDLGSTSKVSVGYSEGSYGTPYPSTKTQCYATVVAMRSDYAVTGLMKAASASYYDALADEAKCALDELKLTEEKCIISGTTTGAYGDASSYLGLQNLMRWKNSNGGDYDATAANLMGDTTSVYGLTRNSVSADPPTGLWELDTSYVIAGTAGTATGVLELKHLDKAITRSNKKGGKGDNRIFFCSEERADDINQLLQPQQRFVAGAGQLELEGGFKVTTYRRVPIISSRYMDKNGCTNTGSWNKDADTDNSMYLLDIDEIEVRVLAGVDYQHVPVTGGTGSNYVTRMDEVGGYFKLYSVFVMRNFNKQVNICNLTAP